MLEKEIESMGYKTASPDRYGLLKGYARENRKNATLAESVLWDQLRENVTGMEFLRQHVIADYIVDFVSRKGGLVIEVDGGYHAERQQQEDDQYRESVLEQMGYHVLRFTNEEVLYETEKVIKRINKYFGNESE